MTFRYDLLNSCCWREQVADVFECWEGGRYGRPIPDGMKARLDNIFEIYCQVNSALGEWFYQEHRSNFVKYCIGMYGHIMGAHKELTNHKQ